MLRIIMAQGRGDRWEWSEDIPYKQLTPIGNQTIIERTVSMLPQPVMLVCSSEFARYLKIQPTYLSLREPTSPSILLGILETLGALQLQEDALILLGDVVYSKNMIDSMLNSKTKMVRFFGRTGKNPITGKLVSEIFGLQISFEYLDQFIQNTLAVINLGGTKLWSYVDKYSPPILEIFQDYTDDIDSREELEQFGNTLILAALNGN